MTGRQPHSKADMPVYSKEKYESELRDLRKMTSKLSLAGISSLQNWAKELFAAQSPPFARRVTFEAPFENDTLAQLVSAVESLKGKNVSLVQPSYASVNAEWVFASDRAALQMSNGSGPVLFYVHGGGFIYGSPATARRATRVLSRLTGGCCLAVQYRFATVHPFPAQLLDVLVAYFSLLSSGAFSRRVIFAGESSGFNLLMAVIQVLLHFRRNARTIRFCGQDLEIELPMAVSGISGFFDITNGLPSWSTNSRWDVLKEVQSIYSPAWKDEDVWPSIPPRADIYCERSAMIHPLVSPVTAEDWRGAPPFFIAVGEERLVDASLYLAQTAARQGVRVRLERWEYMTHVWPTALPKLPHSRRILERWAEFCTEVIGGHEVETQGWYNSFDTMVATPFDVLECTSLTRESLLKYMSEAQNARQLMRRGNYHPKI